MAGSGHLSPSYHSDVGTASPIVPPLPDLVEPISDTTPVQEPPEPQPVVVTAPLVTPTPLTAAEPSTVEPTPPSVTPAAEEPRPREVATPRLPGGPTGAEVSEVETTIRPARPTPRSARPSRRRGCPIRHHPSVRSVGAPRHEARPNPRRRLCVKTRPPRVMIVSPSSNCVHLAHAFEAACGPWCAVA